VSEGHLNSIHLDLSRREEFRRARQVILESRGTQTIQMEGNALRHNRGETIADPPTPKKEEEAGAVGYVLVEPNRHPYSLKIGVNTVGRLPDNDVTITDPHASRRHCSVLVHTSSRCEVHDLASKNGTFLNGQKVTCPTLLKPNDEIRVGDHRFVFMRAADVAETASAPHHKTSILHPCN
jgi:pSer/pThr/pTyr-binding forkhead associated (FHA) protein